MHNNFHQRKKLKALLAMMTDEQKEMDKMKRKDKEKIKKTGDLLKNVYQQIQNLVQFRIFSLFEF